MIPIERSSIGCNDIFLKIIQPICSHNPVHVSRIKLTTSGTKKVRSLLRYFAMSKYSDPGLVLRPLSRGYEADPVFCRVPRGQFLYNCAALGNTKLKLR